MIKKDINATYGKTLQNYRKRNHLTQEKASELTGLAPRYISQIERGDLNGGINTLLAFCNAYKITPNDVLISFLDYNNIDEESYDFKINKLSLRDKELIDELLNYLLSH